MSKYTQSTENELEFLRKIGRHCEHGTSERRLKALDGYITAAKKRTEWGDIDSVIVIAYAKMLS